MGIQSITDSLSPGLVNLLLIYCSFYISLPVCYSLGSKPSSVLNAMKFYLNPYLSSLCLMDHYNESVS